MRILLLILLLALAPLAAAKTAALPAPEVLHLDAPGVSASPLRVRVYRPPAMPADARLPVLYVHDGQDMEAVELTATLRRLYDEGAIRPLLVVAIDMPPDRMAAYGFSDRAAQRSLPATTAHGAVGARAHAYAEWVAHTLVPAIDARYPTRAAPDGRATLGWSLGAAAAFNLGWQYPELFGRVGGFSPSFWLAEDRSTPQSAQRTRIAHRRVDAGPARFGLKLFFAVGAAEEHDDRDGDGVNDALDDVRELALGWDDAGTLRKGLRQLGYPVNPDHAARATRADVALYVLPDGEHRQASWARMLPVFLRWAYAPSNAPLSLHEYTPRKPLGARTLPPLRRDESRPTRRNLIRRLG